MVTATTPLPVRLADPVAEYRSMRAELDEAVLAILGSGRYVHGPEVDAFEGEFADYCGVAHAVGVASGTAALWLSLLALRIGPGTEVITTTFTFAATVEAILHCGARPVLVDVDPDTLNIDVSQVAAAITERTRAIIPVHLYGNPVPMAPLLELCRDRPIALVEDAAQSHGARYQGRRVGSIGAVGCFSFYPSKNLGAMGDGGMIVTNDNGYAERLRLLRDHGRRARYEHSISGYGERLDELQAAILRRKLPNLDRWNDRRSEMVARYRQEFAGLPLSLCGEVPDAEPAYHLFVVRTPERERLRLALAQAGIETGVHYPIPLHQQPAFRSLSPPGGLPVAERASAEVLSLPVHPHLTEEHIDAVIAAVRRAFVVSTAAGSRRGSGV